MKALRIVAVLLATLAFSACLKEKEVSSNLSSTSNSQTEFTHQINLPTELYKGGPQQASPPDGTLPAGTKVKVVQDAGSYTQIESESGEVGYVSSGALEKIAE